jgi:putative acetyltransferase
MLTIREEAPADFAAIHELNRLAFGQDDEAALVDRLRAEGLVVASLVAVEDGTVTGHILFTRLPIDTPAGTVAAVALAPMAVRPERQRQGIGSALVRAGVEVCRALGERIVIVVGHPEYYPRFGFSAELAGPLRSPYSGPACMALELAPGALAGIAGDIRYPDAFNSVC